MGQKQAQKSPHAGAGSDSKSLPQVFWGAWGAVG